MKILYQDKVAIQNDDSIAEVNKVTDANMNEIKNVVNSNADDLENLENENAEQTLEIGTLQEKVTTLEAENTELKETINSMQIPGESEGNPIHIEDSSDLPCEIAVVGNAKQDGEPTPENRVEIVTVGQNGSVEIEVCNKNVFDIEKFKNLNSGNTYETYNGVECLKLKGTTQKYEFRAKENTQYTFKFNVVGHTHTAGIGGFVLHYSDGTTSDKYFGINTGEITITSTANKTLIDITWNSWSAGNYVYLEKSSIQLEVGTTATNYTPHESQTVSLPIQKEMLKIGEYEDTFIKQDGKWYEAHYHPKIVADGTNLEWYKAGVITVDRYSTKDVLGVYGGKVLCTHFKYANGTDEVGTMWLSSSNTQLYLNFAEYETSTVEDLNAWLAEQYANGTPVEIYYESTTPELIECTEEQVKVLESFKTYKNITNITASGIAKLKVNYKKDLATVINNLSQAIVGGN